MENNKPKYNKKFKLINKYGTINESGPGYNIIDNNIIITNINVYNKNINSILIKGKKKEEKKKLTLLHTLKKYINHSSI